MAAITGTIQGGILGAGGNFKQVIVTAPIESASDTITLTEALTGIKSIVAVVAVLSAGQDANLQSVHPTASGLVITVASLNAAGSAATDWTGASVTLIVTGKTGEGS